MCGEKKDHSLCPVMFFVSRDAVLLFLAKKKKKETLTIVFSAPIGCQHQFSLTCIARVTLRALIDNQGRLCFLSPIEALVP